MITIQVPGKPVPQPRHRVDSRGIHYLPKDHPVRGFKARVRVLARSKCNSPLEGPVAVSVLLSIRKPKSLPKYKTWCDKKPDIDNYMKAVLDALNRIAYKDDGQIASIEFRKVYADNEMTLINIWELSHGEKESQRGCRSSGS